MVAIFVLGMARFLALVLAAVVGPATGLATLKRSHEPGSLRNVDVLGRILDGLAVVEGFSLVDPLLTKHLFD